MSLFLVRTPKDRSGLAWGLSKDRGQESTENRTELFRLQMENSVCKPNSLRAGTGYVASLALYEGVSLRQRSKRK